jgi:hypothetical protein
MGVLVQQRSQRRRVCMARAELCLVCVEDLQNM